MKLDRATVQDAITLIDPVFLNSPQLEMATLSETVGFKLIVKVETLNPIRSFKGRGTSYLVRLAKGEEMVCASAGNFGQGMAYACKERNVDLTVFAAQNANRLKVERMRAFGAEVILEGRDFDAAKETARQYAKNKGKRFVEDAKDIETAIGAGTIALELSQYPDALDAVLVPLGNGALINGIGAYLKSVSPLTKVIGVVAAGAPAMDLSWRQDEIITTDEANTIADGIGVRIPVPEALEAMKVTVDDVVQVTDEAILDAMRLAHKTLGLVLEPAGAAGLAAAKVYKEQFKGKCVATILCGSNVTEEQLKRWF